MCDVLNLLILGVFVADLIIIFRASSSVKEFFKKHWLDILMTIPYFRIFRSLRVMRVFKLSKSVKTARALKGLEAGQEIVDIGRTVKGKLR